MKIHTYSSEDAEDVLLVIGEPDSSVFQAPGCYVIGVEIEEQEWNDLLSPWPAEAVFRKGEPFGGNADRLVQEIDQKIMGNARDRRGRKYMIGYSLAGLFALYYCTRHDWLDGCASVSGSLWYPGWIDYLKHNPVHCSAVYLSVGEAEKNTKNRQMASVEDCTRMSRMILSAYAKTAFELNPGGHFNDPLGRMVRALTKLEELVNQD